MHSPVTKIIFEEELPGSLRVGRIVYRGGKPVHPSYPGYTPILVLTKSSPYGSLGPYVLRNEEGHLMENVWQFSKLYPWVPASRQVYSRWDNRVIWEHPQETHVTSTTAVDVKVNTLQGGKGIPNDKYWKWREKGHNNKEAVRYPVGNTPHRKLCLGCISSRDPSQRLMGLAEARREIYLYEYARLVKRQPQYHELKTRLANGENLLIIEIDGPHEESLEYYMETYGVGEDFIENNTMLATFNNISLMLHDQCHSWGHAYALCAALRDWEDEFATPL